MYIVCCLQSSILIQIEHTSQIMDNQSNYSVNYPLEMKGEKSKAIKTFTKKVCVCMERATNDQQAYIS